MKPEFAWGLGVVIAVIITAAIVNQFAPAYRQRLRRVVIMCAIYAVALAGVPLLRALAQPAWVEGFAIAAELARTLTLINVLGLIVFGVLFGRVLPMIAGDLAIGLAYIVAIIIILSHHGLDPTSALATGAVVSAVLAISLQTTLGNILGGVALQLDGSIHEGDWIQLENGKQGRVRAIRWRHTLVETRDWSTIVVPNSQLLANNITILGWRDGQSAPQRMWVWFHVDFRYSPTQVIQVVTDALLGSPIENVAPDPKPSVVCMDFAKDGSDSYAAYAARYWLIDLAPDDPTSSRVRARVYAALGRANIPLAIPARANLVEVHDSQRTAAHRERDAASHLQALRKVPIFAGLEETELRTLADGMSHMVYTPGETITKQGAVAHWLYVMTSGTVDIRVRGEPEHEAKRVATLNAPDYFGEMGLLTGEPRRADVVATTEVQCSRLGKATFERVLVARPTIATELAENVAKRSAQLIAVRDGLDDATRRLRQESEVERVLAGIKQFFGL